MWVHLRSRGVRHPLGKSKRRVSAAKARKALAWVCMILVLVCTCALVVPAEAAKSTNPPAITCEAPATAGT